MAGYELDRRGSVLAGIELFVSFVFFYKLFPLQSTVLCKLCNV